MMVELFNSSWKDMVWYLTTIHKIIDKTIVILHERAVYFHNEYMSSDMSNDLTLKNF